MFDWKRLAARAFACGALACLAPVPSLAQGAPAANAAQGEPRRSLHGADVTVPAGWLVDPHDLATALHPADDGLVVTLTEVDDASDADAAALTAWKRVDPTFTTPVTSRIPRGAISGWDDSVVLHYDLPASAARVAAVLVARHGKAWTVATLQSTTAAFERHAAEFGQVAATLVPTGYVPEVLAGRSPHLLDAARLSALRRFVRDGMAQLRIPGAALAVVSGDRIVLEEGLGVRRAGRPERVDAHTRFMIASNTKGMTTLLLARLVGEGKLHWDDPAAPLLPGLRLADPDATTRLQLRHLVCACTGLPRADYETYFVDPSAPAAFVLEQLALLTPTTEFGSTYQYSNTLAAVAGFVAGHVAHPELEPLAAYDRSMREQVWAPLGMRETGFDDPRTIRGNVAAPNADAFDGGLGLAPQGLNATLLPYRPAGSAWSSAHDMALYVRNEVTEGRLPGGHQWIARDALLARRAHGVSTGQDAWYGMGVEAESIGGVEVVHHGGSVSGYKSDWVVLPEAKLGVVLLTNGDNGYPLVSAMRRKLMELVYDAAPQADGQVKAQAAGIAQRRVAERGAISRAPLARADLAGRYANAQLGEITVRRDAQATVFDFGPWATEVGAKADPDARGGWDFISVAPSEIDDLAFVPGLDEGVRTLTLRDGQHAYVYRELLRR